MSYVYMHNTLEAHMPRPHKTRRCRRCPDDEVFKPRRTPLSELETIRLELGELEAMRLCDLEGYDQEQAGVQIGVSRGTVQRLLKRGRSKTVRALLESAALLIEKGAHDEDLRSDPR